MMLFGHRDVPSASFYRIQESENIAKTPANTPLLFEYNPSLIQYCHANHLMMAVHVKQIKELMIAHTLGANYLIVDKPLVLMAQKIADEYLFDAKILLLSDNNEEDIEFAAINSIDGILFMRAICSI